MGGFLRGVSFKLVAFMNWEGIADYEHHCFFKRKIIKFFFFFFYCHCIASSLSHFIQRTVRVRQEHTLDGMLVHCRVTCTHTVTLRVDLSQAILFLACFSGGRRTLKNPCSHMENLHKNTTQTITRSQNQTWDPGSWISNWFLLVIHLYITKSQ